MSLALYRRYRPESFADVVGQEHVTEPLMQALRTGRVNHAYLFSGPRGCGKTTSARILARCLNCEQGPTPSPCGTCPSCRDLARGGPGSLDVIEIDAASHGGVDDARDLRERVSMSPVRDRYRVYIIDEAHMVSTQGFNALLKVVEEPPEHVKFVFATTEPDKVLQTIRSRTHHYAFRLVPPDVLVTYLNTLCEAENVPVDSGVLPLVVRAGQGSVRDSLSVLDQLIAGAGEQGLDYRRAVALLGYTDGALLDDVLDALGAVDGAALFGVVNRVVESGHDPRRFVEDLLERLRDLILVQAMGPAADGVLRSVPPDQLERMRSQAGLIGAAELSRAADTTNNALTEMVGASSPRMHLELLCARLLLPAADDAGRGLGSRLDRVERRLGDAPIAGGQPQSVPVSAGAAEPAGAAGSQSAPVASAPAVPAAPAQPSRAQGEDAQDQAQRSVGAQPADGAQRTAVRAEPARPPEPARQPKPTHRHEPAAERPPAPEPTVERAPASTETAGARGSVGGVDTERMRRSWTELLDAIKKRRRATWMILSTGAGVHDLADGVLRLSFANQGTAKGFSAGQHPSVVAEAVRDLFNLNVRVEPFVGDTRAARPPVGNTQSAPQQSAPQQSAPQQSPPHQSARGGERSTVSAEWGPATPDPGPEPADPLPAGPTSRAASSVNAWGEPFGDEPPPDDVPPDEPDGWSTPAPRRATSPASPPGAGARQDRPGQPGSAPPSSDRPGPHESAPSKSATSQSAPRASARPTEAPTDTLPAAAAPRKPPSRYEQMQRTQAAPAPTAQAEAVDDEPSVDDPDAEDSGMVGAAVVERMLGGKVIGAE